MGRVEERLWRIRELAAHLNISRSAAYGLVGPYGELPCIPIGRSLRVVPSDVSAWLAKKAAESATRAA